MVMLSPKPDIPEDSELLNRARSKDGHADSEAEDVLQEAYCSAFANLAAFRGEAKLGTWLARIVMNEALGRLRRRRVTVELAAVGDSAGLAAQIIPFPSAVPTLDPEA